ncbi:MAG: hypothetical protein GY757_36790 [bacterium]|nr:hypothetical protein [bacterium]
MREIMLLSAKQLRKTVSVSFIFIFFGMFFFFDYFVAAAANKIPNPNAAEKDLLHEFLKFDNMYAQRQKGDKFTGQNWDDMGKTFSVEGLTLNGERYLSGKIGINFILRANLIAGECCLFASQEYFKEKNKERFLNLYKRGIKTLRQVIVEANKIAEGKNKPEDEIIYLPSYSKPIRKGRNYNVLHELRGYETIGTGFKGSIGGKHYRKVTYDIEDFSELEKFGRVLEIAYDPKVNQISTTETARTMLSHFCPWGVHVYLALEKAGYTSNIDYSILRPFAGGLDKSLHSRLLANLDNLFSSRRENLPVWEVSPMVSDLSISSDRISENVTTRMNRIVGKEGTGSQKGIYEGTVGKLTNRQIRWVWVGEPTYNIWYVAPTIYNWKASDYVTLIFTFYKWATGGIVANAVSKGVGSVGSMITDEFFKYFKTSPIPIPFFSNILTEGVKDQYTGMVSGERISATGTLKAREWFDLKDLFMDLSKYVIDYFEKSQRDILFGGLDPEKLTMGKTYDGTKIPPVLLVGNVTGVQEVPDDEYPKLINVVRYYLMTPTIGSGRVKYDMTNARLIDKPLKGYGIGWSKGPGALKSYEIVTSFAPGAQFLKFQLEPDSAKYISSSSKVELEIWTTPPGEEGKKCATATVKPGDKSVMISLFNKDNPASERDYHYSLKFPDGTMVFNDRDNPRATDMLKNHKARKAEYHTALVPLKTRYELKVKINGSYVTHEREEDRYLINLYSGPRGGGRDANTGRTGRKKQPVTGKLSVNPSKPHYHTLDYDREIKLPLLKIIKLVDFSGGH